MPAPKISQNVFKNIKKKNYVLQKNCWKIVDLQLLSLEIDR